MSPIHRARIGRFASAIVLCLGVLAMAACSRTPVVEGDAGCAELVRSAPAQGASVIVILNDTMRRDRLGIHGGPAQTPAFDAFARDNLLFRNAYAQAPWTRPSVASLFTGLLPSQHGVGTESVKESKALRALPDPLVTLAELFQAAGHRTAAFVSNPWMDERFGFQQGFDTYDDSFAAWGASGDAVNEAALRWLETVPPAQPFFLYLHYLDSHRPYPALRMEEVQASRDRVVATPQAPLSPLAQRELRSIVTIEGANPLTAALIQPTVALATRAYEKGIERFDAVLGRFLERFAQRPGSADVAIAITSDHGEALFERGYANHGMGLHDDELAVPLAMRLPGVSGPADGVSCVVGLIDVLPTLCDYAGLTCPSQLAGRSVLPSRGPAPARFLISEAVGGQPAHRTIRNREWKLIWEPGTAPSGPREHPYLLYDLESDPGETTDLWSSEDPRARAARERLEPLLHEVWPAAPQTEASAVPVDGELEERLRQLGYLGD